MTMQRKMPPIGVADVPKGAGKVQVAALPWRKREGKLQVLMVTSRETGRWVLPKGWAAKALSAPEAAQREAWEEAGVEGQIDDVALGRFAYHKVLGPSDDVPCVVAVFPLKVKALAKSFPERAERKRRWFKPEKAAARVDEPELRELLRGFDPDAVGRSSKAAE